MGTARDTQSWWARSGRLALEDTSKWGHRVNWRADLSSPFPPSRVTSDSLG